MSKTRLRILSVSRNLFNENGFSNVTIRMIALKLKMSSGNLNYHFKKREHILEALYFEMVEVFDIRIKQLDNKEITLEIVKENVFLSLKRMIEYRFFWTDLYNLLNLNVKIKNHFENAYKERFKGYELLFKILNEKEILSNFEFSRESHFLIERMIGFSNTWLYNSFIYNLEIDNDYIESQAENLLGMLYPYFTDLGKSQYKNVFPKFFE
ncbi:TetR/AcrR family transcriptional regulator [uncultured Aquimarina sp.]|uniref:TetR/AcrR family transcriptional regulator n=1 Tax=uncultured Aquimarina sp. TaxID=575652 RepID=UPI002633A602|nr:TetR/AcrR family transcriptional regulator [uncultured Aquimarina sp.]